MSLTANGKAYEMLANLMGICDLARVTGDRKLLLAVTNGWLDIVRNRRYLTGTASTHEHFGDDHELPNGQDAHVGETCVTTTWIQLNLQLLQVTGNTAFADEIERSLYNHLAAAQDQRRAATGAITRLFRERSTTIRGSPAATLAYPGP